MGNREKYIIMIIILTILVVCVGTYAWLSYRTNDTAMVLTVGDINNVQITLKPYQIDTDILPVLTYESEDYIDVLAVNNSNIGMNFKLYYQINSIDYELATTNFKYTITKSTDGNTYIEYKIGNFNDKTNDSILNILEEEMVPKNTTYKYRVYIWLDGGSGGQSSIQGKKFSGELRAEILGLAKAYLVDLTGGGNYYKEDAYREKITSIEFVNYIDISNAVKTYDLGIDLNKPIIGWLEDNENDTYNLYIGSEYKIYGTNFNQAFLLMKNLQTITFDNLDTSEVTNMKSMFQGCIGLLMLDLSSFDTSNVTDMSYMFMSTSGDMQLQKIIGIENFDTSNVTDMSYTFHLCSNLNSLNLNDWNTSNVTNMTNMFYHVSSIIELNLSNFDVSNVTSMHGMFQHMNSLISLNLGNWDTLNVTDMYGMFVDCNSLTILDLSSFNTSNVTTMAGMFDGCVNLTNIYVSALWNTYAVTVSDGMFSNCTKLPNFDSSVVDKTKAHYNTGGYLTYK